MRNIPVPTLILAFAVAVAAMAANPGTMATESGWFDMDNCAFCKNLTEDPELLPHTSWESHTIEKGMMNIMVVDPAYTASAAKARTAMDELGKQIFAGEVDPMTLEMCGHCREFGMILTAGAKMETVKGQAAEVSLITADDPATVKRLHAMVARDNQEMALMIGGQDHAHAH